MLNAPVGAPTRELVPVRVADLGRVAWTVARAFAPGRSRAVAVATWPWWALIVGIRPGFVHDGGDVVVCVVRRRTTPAPAVVLRGLVMAVVVGLTVGTVAGVTGSLTGSAPAGWVVALLWPVTGLVILVVGWAVLVARTARAHRGALRTTGREQRRADLAVVRSADWVVDSVAARPGTDGLALVVAHVRATVTVGQTVLVGASSVRHARLYAGHGLRALPSLPRFLVGTVSGSAPARPPAVSEYGPA